MKNEIMKNEKMKNEKMKSKIIIVALAVVLIMSLSACAGTDVIGKVAKSSFAEVLKAIPDQVTEDEMNGGWSLSAPDGTARFIWSKDYSESPTHDVMIEFDSAPFIAAGLDVDKLTAGTAFDDVIMLGTKLGDDEITYDGDITAVDSFNKIVELYRESVGYHEKLDHYNVSLGNGNMFEWAKDMSTNDKDIVFVLNPDIFIEAGVDPEQIEGWTYAAVEVKDDSGKTIEVMKLLKFFDLQ